MDQFAFHDIQVQVKDLSGSPVKNTSVRLYSHDWFVKYPRGGFTVTDSNGLCSLAVPRGKWSVVVGGGEPFNIARSGNALLLHTEVVVDSEHLFEISPTHSFTVSFKNRNGTLDDVDKIHGSPSSLIPNCRMPVIGNTKGGYCTVATNLTETAALFLGRWPRPQEEGYYLFEENVPTTDAITIDAGSELLKHVHFNGRGMENEPANIVWHLCFPYQDTEQRHTFASFSLLGEGDVYLNIDYLNYTLFLPVGSPRCGATYWFQYKGLNLTEGESFSIDAGGPITRQFSFADRSFAGNPQHTQILFGPIIDSYGNHMRWYNSAGGHSCFTHKLVIYDKPGGSVIHDADMDVSSGRLGLMIDRSFPATAFFELDWDMGPYWLDDPKMNGLLHDSKHLYEYGYTQTPHFDIHVPISLVDKIEDLALRFEEGYAAMVELFGDEPQVSEASHFYVNPVGPWAHLFGQELSYSGFMSWYPDDPASLTWQRAAFHEIGHRVANELYYPEYHLSHDLHEMTANLIADYVCMRIHGEAYVIRRRSEMAHYFFSSITGLDYYVGPQWFNIFFIVQIYLPQNYGWTIHKQFYRNWINAHETLVPLGYGQEEICAALYSLLAGENLSWLFNTCWPYLSPSRIEEGMVALSKLQPPIPGDLDLDADIGWN